MIQLARRTSITGKAFGDWTYTFIYDAGNSNDLTPRGIEYAQINYRGFKSVAGDALGGRPPQTLRAIWAPSSRA
jgi:hypothetical protein